MRNENVKWAPFNAVMIGNNAVNLIEKKKNRISKPILSDEQIMNIERKIMLAFTAKERVLIKYYFDYQIKTINGIIAKIDSVNKNIMVDNSKLLVYNIVDIEIT